MTVYRVFAVCVHVSAYEHQFEYRRDDSTRRVSGILVDPPRLADPIVIGETCELTVTDSWLTWRRGDSEIRFVREPDLRLRRGERK